MTDPLATPTGDMDRATWLASRRTGIGGSDVAAIAGMSRWATPLAVWLEKTGLYVPDDQPTEAMEWGYILEPVVADEFSRRSGVPTEINRVLLRSVEQPFMLANLDREIPTDPVAPLDARGVYEGKTTSIWDAAAWADNKVPDQAALQTHHYLTVTGFSYAYVAVLIGGQRLEWRRIEADPDISGHLVKIEAEFWLRVQNLEPPPPQPADSRLLGEVWQPDPDTTIELPPDVLDLLAERADAKRAEKEAKERADRADAAIKLALGDREYGVDAEGRAVCSWSMVEGGEVSYTREPYRRLTVFKKPKTIERGVA